MKNKNLKTKKTPKKNINNTKNYTKEEYNKALEYYEEKYKNERKN